MNCAIYENSSTFSLVLSLTITILIVVSYVPQYKKILAAKSSIGLSPQYLLLQSLGGLAATFNLVLVSMISLPCCFAVNALDCANSQVSLLQVGAQALCTLAVVYLCVLETNTPADFEQYPQIVKMWTVIKCYMAVFVVFILLPLWYMDNHDYIRTAYKMCGLLSTALCLLQYFPQIRTTYNLKHSGSLSIKMMMYQTPGGYIWCYTLFAKPGSHWSSWLPYFMAATLQGVVLCMCVYYDAQRDNEETENLLA